MSVRQLSPRVHRVLIAFALGLASLSAAAARADEKVDEAKRHFVNGVHLFEDRNFAGALVEFEASFERNPTAVALQNIAVCQKGLFRYADAISTLERMLRQFGPQLSADDKKGAEDAIRDMKALLGSVVLKVDPSDAKISINDAPMDPSALDAPILLAAGEYRVAAEAPGYQRQEKKVTVTSGQKESVIEISLVKNVPPAPEYLPSSGDAAASTPPPPPRGLYGFASFGAGALGDDHPDGVVLQKSRSPGGFAVLRGGYRFTSLFGLELELASSTYTVDACPGSMDCANPGNYKLTSSRIGPAARFMTSGAKSRIVGTVGFGVAVHHIGYQQGLAGQDATGPGGYFEIAGGYELSLGRLLLGVGLRVLTENAQKVGFLTMTSGGLELGAGYAAW